MSNNLPTKPTKEQLERLALIPDPEQRQVLLEAIQRGEDIPEYVWRPINRKLQEDPRFKSLHADLLEHAWRSDRDMSEVIASLNPVMLVHHFAQRARHSARKESGHLCAEPFVVRPFLEEAPSCAGLVVWGIFNPYGPTLWGLALIEVPQMGEHLLYLAMLNPFHREDRVYGLLPSRLSADELDTVLRRFFQRHARGPFALMSESLPSFVILRYTHGDWHHGGQVFREGLTHIPADDFVQFCKDETKCPNDPWGVASLERARAFEELGKARAEKGPPQEVAQRKVTANELQAWWDIASKEEHAAAYINPMFSAWQGAIEHTLVAEVVGLKAFITVWSKLFGLAS